MTTVLRRSAAAALVLAIAATVALAAFRQQADAQPTPVIQARFAVGMVSTDVNGYARVLFTRHDGDVCRSASNSLSTPLASCLLPFSGPEGDRPDTVVVEGVSPTGGGPDIPSQHVADRWSLNGFQVRLLGPSGDPLRNTTVRITYRATYDPTGYCNANACS
jgi:hypothetical protein